jgi:hypothetical protein
MVITISLAVASIFFFFSFSGFSTAISTQDVVNQDEIFISTDQKAVDGFVKTLGTQLDEKQQALGVILSVVMKDSNGKVIPQEENFLNIPAMGSLISVNNGELLDYAKIQFDFEAVLAKDDHIGQITVNYEIYSNEATTPFLTGKAFGSGTTQNNRLNLDFEQGSKTGNAIELSFEKGEIPVVTVGGNSYRNTLEVKVTKVSAIVGKEFETKQYEWSGQFPVYTLKFDADANTRTVRDYRGIAIQTLPNDIGIQTCGMDSGRFIQGGGFSPHAPVFTVTKDGKPVLTAPQPSWGNHDADFNSSKCGSIASGLERSTTYLFTVDGTPISVTTPATPILYKVSCTRDHTNEVESCTSNFGWSK